MRIGVCCSEPEKFPLIKKLGYDYVEPSLFSVSEKSDEDFRLFKKALDDNGLKAESYNGFFPWDWKITGPGLSLDNVKEYASRALSRAEELGGKIAVLGNGGARRVPDGYPIEKGIEDFVKVLRTVGDEAERHGMKIAIEPLNASETNIINTVMDGVNVCKTVNHQAVGVLADFYHVFRSGEDMSGVLCADKLLYHTHLARADMDRRMPKTPQDDKYCEEWAAALKKIEYKGRMSLEGHFGDDFDSEIENVLSHLEVFKRI